LYTNLDEINIQWVVIPGRIGDLYDGEVRPNGIAREFYLLVVERANDCDVGNTNQTIKCAKRTLMSTPRLVVTLPRAFIVTETSKTVLLLTTAAE
jgi:hypothetical protein